MKVTLLTYYTPYKENLRGVSALPYYLIKYRPKDVELKIYTLNINNLDEQLIENVSKELGVEIILAKYTNWQYKYRNNKIYGLISRFFRKSWRDCFYLTDETVSAIDRDKPNIIWTYLLHLCDNLNRFQCKKILVTGCDDPVLLYKRQMELWKNRGFLYKITIGLRKRQAEIAARKAACFPLHVVGIADREYFKKRYPTSVVYYIAHPHYQIVDKEVSLSKAKINIIWAGAYDLYMKEGADELTKALILRAHELKDKIKLSFLGKGWNTILLSLRENGYDVQQLGWVNNYIEEISKYDVQLTPISLGTGTKAKVLDAMANGVLVIGTPFAMESICEDSVGGIVYHNPNDVPDILLDVYSDRKKYQNMIIVGRERIRSEHNPAFCSSQLFGLMHDIVS